MFPASSVHYVWILLSMGSQRSAQIVLSIVISLGCCHAADATSNPDAKKSHAALVRGQHLDQAGRRQEAIAADTEAVEADPANAAVWRARGQDYIATSNREKGMA